MASSEVKLETHTCKYMSNDSGTSPVHKDPVTTLDNTKVERLENKDILFEASNNRDFEVQCNDNEDACNLKLDDIILQKFLMSNCQNIFRPKYLVIIALSYLMKNSII